MSEVALRIEQMIRGLASKRMRQVVEEILYNGTLYDEMRVTAKNFLGSDTYKGMLEAHLVGFLDSGLLESIVRDRVQNEVNRISAENLQSAIRDAVQSSAVRNAVSDRLSQVLAEMLQSESVRTRLAGAAKEAVEASMHALTNQIIHGFNERMSQPLPSSL